MIKRYWQVQEISSLVQAEIQLNIPRLVWESTYVTWIEIDFVNIPPCTSLYVLHWFLKESFDSFLKLMCPIFPRRNSRYLSEVRQNYHLRIVWLASFKIRDDWPSSSHISDWLLGESRHLARWFPANMPWPMTLAPTNEAISREF